jgi:prephenate dehydrogenase
MKPEQAGARPSRAKIAVLGVGLIGGSIGLAARSRAGACVVGYDRDERALAAALELGALDEAASDVETAVRGAQAAFVATPVGALVESARAALAAAAPGCVVSDVGSTKRAIVSSIEDERFVGGHPLAGAESAGVEHARADLFDGATWYLTPRSPTPLLERLQELIAALGAHPVAVEASAHDRLMAHLSHLPHVLANVLVEGAACALLREQRGLSGAALAAGPSFRDATRVAGANSSIWVDIYLSNSDALIDAIDDAVKRLGEVRGALARSDAQALTAWNERAGRERRQMAGAGSVPDA